MAKHDYYDAYKLRFIHDEERPSLRDFAKKMAIDDVDTFLRHAKRYDWEYYRESYWNEVAAEVKDRMKGLHVHDNIQKLREIQALKAKAWEGAMEAEFKTADKAISSYTELEKLERLILGQSTENITVQQLDAYLMEVVRIIKEEVTDMVVLEQIRVRLSSLTLGDVANGSADQLPN